MDVSQNEVIDKSVSQLTGLNTKNELHSEMKRDPNMTSVHKFAAHALASVGDYLQLSQVGKVVKSFSVDGGQLVVAKIPGKKKKKSKRRCK